MDDTVTLYDYWRSSASYRVRIALNLLGKAYAAIPVNLLTGAHRDATYLERNPQGILPTLEIDGNSMTQSLAIIEYLHATSQASTLMPVGAESQYRVRQLSYAIAMEIHPICNLNVGAHVAVLTGGGDAAKKTWMQHFISKGLTEFEGLLTQSEAGDFCYGDTPTMADCCLIPQLYNADRWGVDYAGHAHIARIAAVAGDLKPFADAHPDAVGPPED